MHGSGRIAKKMTKNNIRRLEAMFNHHHGVSQRQAARKFNCSQPYILKTLKNKTSIRMYNKNQDPATNRGSK